MKLFITGIEGFVGRHLSKALIDYNRNSDEKFEICGMYYPKASIEHLKDYDFQLSPVDIADKEAVTDVLGRYQPDYIIHLAGIAFVPHAMKDPFKAWNVNLHGGLHILEWIRQKSPETRAIIVSTGEVYGAPDSQKDIPYSEKSVLNPANVYAATKASLDIAARQYNKTWNLDLVIARPYNHIGPWQSENFVVSSFASQIAKAKAGKTERIIKVGNLSAARDFTDVRDVVRAYIMMLRDVRPDVYNICSSNPVKIRYILDKLIEISDFDVEVQVDSSRLRPVDVPVISALHDKLTDECGWQPEISLDKTLEDTFHWHYEKIQAES
ncbi:MAG: GDP-mannose 4,6-dehydratase [Candidatus Zixiibacteriota bacterium]